MVGMLDLRSARRGFESLSTVKCYPGQVVNTRVPLSPSSIIWYQPMGLAVGLALHWPCVTDISGSLPTGSRPRGGR